MNTIRKQRVLKFIADRAETTMAANARCMTDKTVRNSESCMLRCATLFPI
jgi:hypothetical protein